MTLNSLAMAAVFHTLLLGSAPRDAAQDAYARSAESGRPLVFLFGADWCPACRVMKDRTLPEVDRKGGLRGLEFAYIDIEARPEFSRRYLRGNSVPQLVRFDREGERWKARYLIGAHSAERVAEFLAADRNESPARYSSYQRRGQTP